MATRSGKPLPLLKDPDGPRSPTKEPDSDLGQRCRGDGGGGSGIIPAARSAAPPPYGWPFLSGGGGKRGTAVSAQFLRRSHTGKLRNCLTWLSRTCGGGRRAPQPPPP